MRGKKFYTKLCLVIIAILCLGIVGVVFKPAKISKVQAEDTTKYMHETCSQKYDDGVVFSVEQVYFANTDESLGVNRSTPLYLGADGKNPISNILGYSNTSNYFLNYGGLGGPNHSLSKRIINNGEYAYLEETFTKTVYTYDNETGASTQVSLNQGILISLGSLIFDDSKVLHTNSETYKVVGEDKIEKEVSYTSQLQSINIEMKRNGKVFTSTETTGEASLRTYNNGLYFDFVYFLDASASNEGFYEISFTYTKEDGQSQSHSFNFYILLSSKYDNVKTVNGQEYNYAPNISNAEVISSSEYSAKTYNSSYPVLSYDYKHYDMRYTYIHNDLVSNVEVRYEEILDEGVDRLVVENTTNGTTTTKYYSCKEFVDNNIVSFLFANVGKYQFEFNYVYYYNNERLVVSNLEIEDKILNIRGYELKYAKTGFASSDLRHLSIVKNGTMVIPVNGYVNSNVKSNPSQDLGYMYTFVEENKKSGDITAIETADITSAMIDSNTAIFNTDECKFTDKLSSFTFVETDQGGLWFNLNDYYDLNDCYYIYSPTPFIIANEENGGANYLNSKLTLNKVTTFTKTGYYFVKAGYQKDTSSSTVIQYFAFKISSGVANIELYTTAEDTIPQENHKDRLYSNQYTNKNVYAIWDDPTTFASSQKATLYNTREGYNNIYESKGNLLNVAKGIANVSIESSEYIKGKTLLTKNGSYLLEVKVDSSDTKAYYYFTIDKEDISGLDVLAVSSASIGSSTVYNVARDSKNNAITYTSRMVIDKNFTFWWDDKKSGAQISGSYTYTPILSSVIDAEEIEGSDGFNKYLWLINDYTLGTTSNKVSIQKPATKISSVNPNNVLVNQGIYWFNLIDEAGNEMNYMVIVDKTKAVIKATTAEEDESKRRNIVSGEMVAEDVIFEWGTHKAIQLSENIDDRNNSVLNNIYAQLYETPTEKYYKNGSSNFSSMNEYFKLYNTDSSIEFYLVVANKKMVINDKVEILKTTYNLNHAEIKLNNWHNITIALNDTETVYVLNLYGENQVEEKDSVSYFTVVLNPDKSEGTVKSKADETERNYKKVYSYNTTYRGTQDDGKLESNYNTKQASDDGLFVFEWNNNDGSKEFEVGEVYYEYYPLLSQELLNQYDSTDDVYKFYPYAYDINNVKKEIIYDSNTSNYEIDSDGTKTIYRSTILNAGYVLYYDEARNLVSKYASLPGMYIITRVYKSDTDTGTDSKVRKYIFFIDRNNIIDYSTTNTSNKIVGEYIDVQSQESLEFKNFTQELAEHKFGNDTYKIYLQTNRLPMEIRVPTGKYASLIGNEIVKTSCSNSGLLNLSITFIDKYKLLGYKDTSGNLAEVKFRLYNSQQFEYSDKGYLTYLLNQDNLDYYGNIDNMANIENYLAACKELNREWLSLPGIYLIELSDNVGKELDDQLKVVDFNVLTLGVEITKANPSVEVYANQVYTNKTNADTMIVTHNSEFNTAKAYVRYELKKPDGESYNAQIDNSYIYITRDGKLYYNSATGSGDCGIDNTTQFANGYKYIQVDEQGNTVIWLDTGLEIVDGKIISYKEYTYKIYVRYELGNGAFRNSYIYNVTTKDGIKQVEQYYESEITVNIDRTPFLENLENAVKGQEDFIEEYIIAHAEEGFEVSGKLDSKIYNTVAYRGPDGEDYYAVVNTLYYYYINKGDYVNAENSMYAVNVNRNAKVTLDGSMYYRKMYFDNTGKLSTQSKDRRMALLPICEQYFSNVSGFATFSKNSFDNFSSVMKGSVYWSDCLRLSNDDYGYYEIIELDVSGNMTQYLIYVDKNESEEINRTVHLEFKDVTYNYDIAFNFVGSPSILIKDDSERQLVDQFSLIPFDGVVDMFGLSIDRDGVDEESKVNKFMDWFYKITIKSNTNEYVYYLNRNNLDLAEYIYNIFSAYTDQNYAITLTNRYNKSLTVFIEVLSKEYDLNTDSLKAILNTVGANYWYINPEDLNSNLDNGVIYYVRTIELKDLTDDSVSVRFDLDRNGQVIAIYKYNKDLDLYESVEYFIADENEDSTITRLNDYHIRLDAGREYEARLIDCARKEYGPIRLYAYKDGADYNLIVSAYGEYSPISNVYYSANPVVVQYNTNVYSNIIIEVEKDGLFIGRFNDGFNENNVLVEAQMQDKYNILTFNPYQLVEGVKDVGAKLEFRLSLLYDSRVDKTIEIVLDNRMPLINLVNTSGEDKSNIVRAEYVNSQKEDDVVVLDTDTLFSYAPTLTLSETIVLDWGNYDPTIYENENLHYYTPHLYLVEFTTKTDWNVSNLGALNTTMKNISPKEGALGRYVLIVALHSKSVNIVEGDNVNLISDNLICYKALVFNISSTANAMYEVQNSAGEVQDYDSLISGEDLFKVLSEEEQKLFKGFGFEYDEPTAVGKPDDNTTDPGAWELYEIYLSKQKKYQNFIKFEKQAIPLYITTTDDNYNLVPNGDNGIQADDFTCIVGTHYTLVIYKVYSKVHTTYVAILNVEKTSELVDTHFVDSSTAAIRFVYGTDNITKDLVSENDVTFNAYGSLFFTNFYRGEISDNIEDQYKLNLARHNRLYLEVWYKYNDDDKDPDRMKKVGDFYGEKLDKTDTNFIKFSTSGTYIVYLKDLAGNVRLWSNGSSTKDYLVITVMPEVIVTVNNDIPVDYNYYNLKELPDGTFEGVKVDVLFAGAGYYDNGSIRMYAYFNGSDNEYITQKGGRNNITSYTFEEYGTYRVVIDAKVNGEDITKTIVFSIINAKEARLALDFTQISKFDITKVINSTTKENVTSKFKFLLNEGFIYSKLITFDRLSASNVFGSTMGKQTFTVYYTVNTDKLVPARECSFEFTVNNQTPSLHSSVKPGESTTKDITIRFNAQTIYRQVGDCYIVVNGNRLLPITSNQAYDGTTTLTLSGVGDYYVRIETDSGRVITSFKVTIKEKLNTMSIILIVAAILVVVGIIVTFIVLRTRMKVK